MTMPALAAEPEPEPELVLEFELELELEPEPERKLEPKPELEFAPKLELEVGLESGPADAVLRVSSITIEAPACAPLTGICPFGCDVKVSLVP